VTSLVVDGSRRAQRGVLARAGALAAVVIGLDQLTKHTIATGIAEGQTKKLVPGITFVHVQNSGVAFSFLAGGGAIVLVCTVAALLLLVTFLLMRPEKRLLWLPAGLLIGGAIGNLIDRIVDGYVTDFIKLPHWPAFNVADMGITFGVIALVLVLEFGSRRDH
jgi:signal peptidase II